MIGGAEGQIRLSREEDIWEETPLGDAGEPYKYKPAAAWWATSCQVVVISIAIKAIYLMYWPVTTSPLWVPDEGFPAGSQQGPDTH